MPTTYEIVLRGRPSRRLLHPLLDDFSIERSAEGTRLIGAITDASQLHGVITHITSMSLEVVSIAPLQSTDSGLHALDVPEPDRPQGGPRS